MSRYWLGPTNAVENVHIFEPTVLLHDADRGDPFFRSVVLHSKLEWIECIVLKSVGCTAVDHNGELMFPVLADYGTDKPPVLSQGTAAAASHYCMAFFVPMAI